MNRNQIKFNSSLKEKTKEKKSSSSSKKKDKKEEESAVENGHMNGSTNGDTEEIKEPRRVQRTTSNVFALFNQSQIQEFKEAFTMIDANRDGIIDIEDLKSIWQNLGREPDPKVLKEMLAECPSQLNFTHFLTLFGEKMSGTDSETALKDAFIMFDEEGKGQLHEEFIKDLLMNVGDQFSKDEIKQFWKEAPIDGGQMDYQKFVRLIKRGDEEA